MYTIYKLKGIVCIKVEERGRERKKDAGMYRKKNSKRSEQNKLKKRG